MTGNQWLASNRRPVKSHSRVCRAPYPFSRPVVSRTWFFAAQWDWASSGTMTQADARKAATPTNRARRIRRRRSDQTMNGKTTMPDEGEVPRLVVQGGRDHHEEDGRQDRSADGVPRVEGAVRESPGERERPRRPQLGPHAVAAPDVRHVLVADSGGRGQQRRDGGGRGGGPAAQTEQARRPVDDERPQRQQQVHRPAEHGVGVDERAEEAGGHRRQALVVQELRRAEPEVREPTGQRQVALVDAGRREARHLLVDRAVVEDTERPSTPGGAPTAPRRRR